MNMTPGLREAFRTLDEAVLGVHVDNLTFQTGIMLWGMYQNIKAETNKACTPPAEKAEPAKPAAPEPQTAESAQPGPPEPGEKPDKK